MLQKVFMRHQWSIDELNDSHDMCTYRGACQLLCALNGLPYQIPLRQSLRESYHDSPPDVVNGSLKGTLGQQHLIRNLVL